MKAKSLLVLLVASFGFVQAHAQNVVVAAGVTVTPATVQTAVAPPEPAVCTAPVVYRAPMPYPTPVACGASYYAAPCYPYVGYTPNVIYFGGPYSHLRNYYSGNAAYGYPYSSVVCFGRGEAYERGYYFNRRR